MPIAEIGALCRERGIVFHTDAAQAVGKLPVDVGDLNVDMLGISGHKLYGPKGVGALYVSRQCPTALEPLIIGGAQQHGLRAGTVPTFLCVGLGEACRSAGENLEQNRRQCEALRNEFWSELSSRVPDAIINGDPERRLPGNLNVLLPGKGISTGDFAEALAALLGPDAGGLSASTVARLTEVWADQHAHWLKRDLSARHYVYFWADGIHVQARLEDDAQCLLVIIGATPEGKKELVGLIDGVRESAQSWRELLLDLKRRGLAVAPELAIADGALGFWKAIEEVWPRTRSQRCWVR